MTYDTCTVLKEVLKKELSGAHQNYCFDVPGTNKIQCIKKNVITYILAKNEQTRVRYIANKRTPLIMIIYTEPPDKTKRPKVCVTYSKCMLSSFRPST